jgi:hypothetical protein
MLRDGVIGCGGREVLADIANGWTACSCDKRQS